MYISLIEEYSILFINDLQMILVIISVSNKAFYTIALSKIS